MCLLLQSPGQRLCFNLAHHIGQARHLTPSPLVLCRAVGSIASASKQPSAAPHQPQAAFGSGGCRDLVLRFPHTQLLRHCVLIALFAPSPRSPARFGLPASPSVVIIFLLVFIDLLFVHCLSSGCTSLAPSACETAVTSVPRIHHHHIRSRTEHLVVIANNGSAATTQSDTNCQQTSTNLIVLTPDKRQIDK